MREEEREREDGEWKRMTKNKRDKRRKGLGGGRVNGENNIHHLTL